MVQVGKYRSYPLKCESIETELEWESTHRTLQ